MGLKARADGHEALHGLALIDHRHNVLTNDLGPGHDVVCSIWMLIDVHR
jgi:hypothetical protein